jgi:hypothetical protein
LASLPDFGEPGLAVLLTSDYEQLRERALAADQIEFWIAGGVSEKVFMVVVVRLLRSLGIAEGQMHLRRWDVTKSLGIHRDDTLSVLPEAIPLSGPLRECIERFAGALSADSLAPLRQLVS